MSTATIKKIKNEIKRELIKEFILPVLEQVKDAEGTYKETFIKDVLRAIREKPKYKYNAKTFLKLLNW